ncbi:hypothetical protein ACQEVF_58070 [Nonomuraea polychroma]|uniref:hypothetical protein n=1 Tax=Nonomuraea polychroma TaxID=46176 RepID=UPI003D950277
MTSTQHSGKRPADETPTELTPEEFDAALLNHLRRLGLTWSELVRQARSGTFDPPDARKLWHIARPDGPITPASLAAAAPASPARVAARVAAMTRAAHDPDVTRAALNESAAVRQHAIDEHVSHDEAADELRHWLAAHADVVRIRDMYVDANACQRLCRTLGVPAPPGLQDVIDAALAKLSTMTRASEKQVMESLHHPTSDALHQLREHLVAASDDATLHAILRTRMWDVIRARTTDTNEEQR